MIEVDPDTFLVAWFFGQLIAIYFLVFIWEE